MPSYQQYLKATKSEIQETDVQTVQKIVESGATTPVVIDVREKDEYVQGYVPGATWISRGNLESKIEDVVPNRDTPVILYCAGGNRSAFAAKSLQQLGYTHVQSMAGGFSSWKRSSRSSLL